MSIGLIFLPALNSETDFLRTFWGLTPCLRSCALTIAGLTPLSSPFIFAPCLFVPSQVNTLVFIAFCAMLVLGHPVHFFQAGHALHGFN